MTTTQASPAPTTQTTPVETKKVETKEKVIDKNRVYVGNLSYRTTSEELKAYFLTVCSGVTTAEVISYPNGRSKGCGLVEFETAGDAEKAIKELNNTELATRKIFIREDREAKGFQGGGLNKGAVPHDKKKQISNSNNNSNNNNNNNSNNNGNNNNNRRNDQGEGRRNYNYTNNNSRSYETSKKNYQPRDQKQQAPRTKNTDGANLYVGNLPYSTQDSDLKALFEEHGDVLKAEVVLDRTGRSKGFGMVKMATVTDASAAITGLNEQTYQNRKIGCSC